MPHSLRNMFEVDFVFLGVTLPSIHFVLHPSSFLFFRSLHLSRHFGVWSHLLISVAGTRVYLMIAELRTVIETEFEAVAVPFLKPQNQQHRPPRLTDSIDLHGYPSTNGVPDR